ncbi:MAG: hypothetical protein ACFFDP_02765 [Promethearchaeota archaeon]
MAYGSFTSLDTVIIGGWFVIIGYFFILFIYFLAFRYRETKNPFHLGFGLFFLLLGVGRAFFLVYDYYAKETLWWTIATTVSWFAIFTVFLTLTYQILEKHLWQVLLTSCPPLIIAILVLILPQFFYPELVPPPLGYFAINYAILPLYSIVLPILFFYIGFQLVGQLRISNFLIGGGFMIYYMGRVAQSSLVIEFLNAIAPFLGNILAPILVFFSLVLIAAGVLYLEQE